MNNFHILALWVMSFCSLYAQTLQPPPLLFNQGGPKAAFTLADRHKFVLGGNWGYESLNSTVECNGWYT